MTEFGADEAFGKTPKKIKEHYGIEVPASSARVITERHGERIEINREILGTLPRGGARQLIGEMDGCMLPIVRINPRGTGPSPADRRKRPNMKRQETRGWPAAGAERNSARN